MNLRKYVPHYFQNVSDFILEYYLFLTLSILCFWSLDQLYVRLPYIFPMCWQLFPFSDCFSLSTAFLVGFLEMSFNLFSIQSMYSLIFIVEWYYFLFLQLSFVNIDWSIAPDNNFDTPIYFSILSLSLFLFLDNSNILHLLGPDCICISVCVISLLTLCLG